MADRTARPDRLVAVHPLRDWTAAFAAVTAELADAGTDRLVLGAEPLTTMTDLRVDPDGVGTAALADAIGGRLPLRPGTVTVVDEGRAIWLGPDEWLLVATDGSGDDPGRGAERERRLGDVAARFGGVAVDVSAQRTAVRVGGPAARALLSSGCALDLRPASFPARSCAQTLVGGAPVLLLAPDPAGEGGDDFVIFVRTSVAGHLAAWLLDAAEEFRPVPAPAARG